jgi:hypothetical protein
MPVIKTRFILAHIPGCCGRSSTGPPAAAHSEGYLQPNLDNVYSVNGATAKKGPDGSVTIQFGGCDGKVLNCLPITQGWNYTVRLFLPRREILDGTWRFPEAQPVS